VCVREGIPTWVGALKEIDVQPKEPWDCWDLHWVIWLTIIFVSNLSRLSYGNGEGFMLQGCELKVKIAIIQPMGSREKNCSELIFHVP